jgi:translation initiation factor 2-alpha kinase 4
MSIRQAGNPVWRASSGECSFSAGLLGLSPEKLISFDIVSPIRSYAAEAELLEVVDKVISEFRGARGSALVDYEFHVSHESVLATILAHVPERNRSDVLKFFKDIGSGLGFSESRLKLAAIPQLNKAVHDELEQCCIVGA